MTVQTVKLGRERFVLLREKDSHQLKAQAPSAKSTTRPAAKARRPATQDQPDIAVAKRREKEAVQPYSQLRKELWLL